MSHPIILLAVGALAGAGLGALVTATMIDHSAMAKMHGSDTSSMGTAAHDHSAHAHSEDEHHKHKMIEVEAPAPSLSLVVHPDGPQSRNLEIVTTNFTFDPASVNGNNTPGAGHAHVYVNNVKLPRAYAPWVHLSALPKGTHTVRVTLNANDHSYLATGGTQIEATTTFTIE